jgi:hypothetical protein
MRQLVTAILVGALSGSATFAQSLQESVAAAAASAAVQGPDRRLLGISSGQFWTGIGLVSAGGLFLRIGATDTDKCVASKTICDSFVSSRSILLTLGASLAGVGAVVLVTGKRKDAPLVEVGIVPRGVTIRGQMRFGGTSIHS